MDSSAIDEFAAALLEESKRFLERAEEVQGESAEAPFLHAALMLCFCALEAHVNSIADELSTREELSVHERGVLLEREVRLDKGEFILSNRLRISRLEDRLDLLHSKFSRRASKIDWRAGLSGAVDLRNKLTHPKVKPQLTLGAVKKAVEAVIISLNELYLGLYARELPAYRSGLLSSLDF